MDFEFVELGGDAFAFQNKQDGKMLAEITWTLLADVMVMDHTYVSESLRGQGVAKKLLDRAAVYARDKGYKMEAVCSYVVTAFERYKEYDDVKA
ncbi:GNAT family N-acetyltransferase [Sporosarcina highlanderae]|uniref:GNAT family N-acetyltransferase n=1 Tax=Sporosarcina highlanderae TaxID=3035916 RepID=A0ABT8JMR6_9BACL|nr:GNAT family N-acetyltransferase [Sporosarcina highlanderae]MDN4606360.1 GNAT family N-acetyltransferase [Sporosarcina highlanderae]